MAIKINWIFRSSIVLSLIIFIIGLIIEVLLLVAIKFSGKALFLVSFYYWLLIFSFLLVAYVLGYFYTKKSAEIMPKKLRRNIAIFIVVETILLVAALAMTSLGAMYLVMYTGFNLTKLVISGLLVYWVLGFGGRSQIKKQAK